MAKLKLSGKDLRSIGYPESPVISLAMDIMEKNFKRNSKEYALGLLKAILAKPHAYVEDEILGKIARALIEREEKLAAKVAATVSLNSIAAPYNIFGAEFIEEGAVTQMNSAVRLPVSVAGALMPDAHQGYGLPIGGVLAVENAVIPYGVGVDIGCRMCLSVFDIDPGELSFRPDYFLRELNEATLFGSGRTFTKPSDDEVLYRSEFNEIPILRTLREKAISQLGSSGGGNHFVEFGIVDIPVSDAALGIEAGSYLGLLSHSGSRAIGANVANHYTKLAKDKRHLPPDAANLAWFTLDEEEGIEYFMAMNLAGDYASACHHVIHNKIAKELGRQPVKMVENHHNFAWKEMYEGKEVIVHRKGATPAGKDVLGIIPGSMTAPGFIVKGKGETASINSASHGAGRKMSRTAALNSVTASALKEELQKHNVRLIGGGLDEAPFAYKDIKTVMNAQKQLVETLGTFTPKIVKMDDTPPRQRKKVKEVMGE
ncbi:MAG TPA: RtcB family protein [Segetibacter sp.]|nr:RtcB family protein [Segetibacter sp.]